MLLTGEPITATEAALLGLVNKVVSSNHVMDAALELASHLTNKSPITMRAAKKLANIQLNADLQTAIELEKQKQSLFYIVRMIELKAQRPLLKKDSQFGQFKTG